jgi:hydrogenase/urease accessory protein HupE
MLQLITTALAAFTVLMALRLLLPFALPVRIAPVVVSGVAYGLLYVPPKWHHAVLAAACAGLVAVVHRFAVGEEPEPWSLRDLIVRLTPRPKPKSGRTQGPVGNRIPQL